MTVESIPKFSASAAKAWAAIPPKTRTLLLSNVWCSGCRAVGGITNFRETIKDGDLLLEGTCSVCGHDVTRLIEGAEVRG